MRRRARVAAWAVLALLIAGSAPAEIYRWTDEKGQPHFTSSPEKVPPRYRYQLGRLPNDAKGTVNIVEGSDAPSTNASPNERLEHLRHQNRNLTKPPRQPTEALRIGGRPKPTPIVKPEQPTEIKCNSRGEKCRRIQTQEFRDWKALQKYKDGVPAASED